jgi:hypothetical protein
LIRNELDSSLASSKLVPPGFPGYVCFQGHHSNSPRAKQTLYGILEGADTPKLFFKSPVQQTDSLNEMDFSLNPEFRAEMDKLKEYDDRMNFLLQNQDSRGQLESIVSCGKRVIEHAFTAGIPLIGSDGLHYIEIVTHGPLVEAALIQLVDPSIKDIKYLHGGFREGENFRAEYEHGPQWIVYFRGESVKLNVKPEYEMKIKPRHV